VNYLEKLYKELKYRNYSIKTISSYTNANKCFLNFINNDIDKISNETIINFILDLQEKNYAPKTLNLYKQAIKFLCLEILNIKVNLNIKLSKTPKKLPIILSKNEIKYLIKQTNNTKHKLLLELSYGAGLSRKNRLLFRWFE